MQKIKDFLNSITPVNENEWIVFSSKLEYAEIPKKEVILKMGKVENYLYYIEEGMIRYYIPKDENDLTFGFGFENELASGYDSFITRTPCSYEIQALTPTKIWRLNHSDLSEIYNETSVGNKLGRLITEMLFVKEIKRELSLLNETAENRYLNLFNERPEVLQKIPLKHIASYIGVTPQALSRIRKRIS